MCVCKIWILPKGQFLNNLHFGKTWICLQTKGEEQVRIIFEVMLTDKVIQFPKTHGLGCCWFHPTVGATLAS